MRVSWLETMGQAHHDAMKCKKTGIVQGYVYRSEELTGHTAAVILVDGPRPALHVEAIGNLTVLGIESDDSKQYRAASADHGAIPVPLGHMTADGRNRPPETRAEAWPQRGDGGSMP